MLRANVGLSRKLSKDYNSTGYSINLDGEITASISDPEAVVEQVKELFDLAEEALDQQIERGNGDAGIADRDVRGSRAGRPDQHDQRTNPRSPSTTRQTGAGNGQQDEELATNKQVNYLLTIGKRQQLSTSELEAKIAEILGREVGLYDLSKRSAAVVIDALTNGAGNGKATAR